MNLRKQPPLWLLTLLITFPQLGETIYSPALPDIAASYGVSHQQAAQTLTVYFAAFAVGVLLWGWLSDRLGRRPAMLIGLTLYGAGSLLALIAASFWFLLLARMVAAFGAAVGSVVVQTMLRDTYEPPTLAKIFSVLGAALALSPVAGLVSGSWLVSLFGHTGIFAALLLLAGVLWCLTFYLLPETRPTHQVRCNIAKLAKNMALDKALWRSAILVGLFNAMIFSYYSLAPFLFSQLGWDSTAFGWTGFLLAFSSLMTSFLNRKLLVLGYDSAVLITVACRLAMLSGIAAWCLRSSPWILLPVAGVVVAFGVAIPNVLSHALQKYRNEAGSAAALFGLSYYLILSMLLGIAGLIQHLGIVLTLLALLAWLCQTLLARY